jgi:Neuraminidase (sialidase)
MKDKYGLFILLGLVTSLSHALPFSVTPRTALPTTYPSIASYTVSRNATGGSATSIIKWLPPNVSISAVGTTCATSLNTQFALAAGQSCTLNLNVTGVVSRDDPNPQHHLMVCFTDRASCAGPTPGDSINVRTLASSGSLTAVGFYSDVLDKFPLTYISRDNGVTWSVSTTLPVPVGNSSDGLNGTACSSNGLQCTAVGQYENGVTRVPLSYVSVDGGDNWSNSTTLPPVLGTNSSLRNVACSSDGLRCSTVGAYELVGITQPLSYTSTDGGVTWSASATLPPGHGALDVLFGVACSSSGLRCTAVGFYDTGAILAGLSYTSIDGGANWVVSSTLPPPEGSTQNVLNSVACDTTGLQCSAVGYYSDGAATIPLSYVSTDGGDTWALSTTPPPFLGSNSNSVNAISCSSTGLQCTAVGYYNDGDQFPSSYYTTDGGENWATSTTLPPAQSILDELAGVHCSTDGLVCASVGRSSDNGVNYTPLSFTSSNGGVTWTLSTTLPPLQGITSELYQVG